MYTQQLLCWICCMVVLTHAGRVLWSSMLEAALADVRCCTCATHQCSPAGCRGATTSRSHCAAPSCTCKLGVQTV